MKFCDITIAYNERSGGIRTYIDEKRRFLMRNTDCEHLLIVPGEKDAVERDGRSTIVRLAGPLLPNQDDYRVFVSLRKLKSVLRAHAPDIVELGSYYMEPWAAFSYRRRRREAGRPCLLGGYFHTDVAEAYVAAPLRAAAHNWLGEKSEALGHAAEKIADIAATGAEQYIRYVFSHCDVAMAAAPLQASRLREHGVDEVAIVPLGVDLELFSPTRRSRAVRERQGAADGTDVLVYAGRLSTEKRVHVLIDAFENLPRDRNAQLWIVGDGPLREEIEERAKANPRIRLAPYESDRVRFAELLASADLYITAGPHETFGLSVIEAQACGLAVVGVDAGALPERVPSELGRLGPVDDARAMAENILAVLAERKAMGERARRHIEQNFSWDRAFTTLLHCYAARTPRAPGRLREPETLLAM